MTLDRTCARLPLLAAIALVAAAASTRSAALVREQVRRERLGAEVRALVATPGPGGRPDELRREAAWSERFMSEGARLPPEQVATEERFMEMLQDESERAQFRILWECDRRRRPPPVCYPEVRSPSYLGSF